MQEERGIPSGVSRNKLRGVLRFQKKTFNSRGLGGGGHALWTILKKKIHQIVRFHGRPIFAVK